MICVNLSAPATLTAGAIIPFDNVVCATNDGITLDENALKIITPGWYTASIYAILSSSSAVSDSVYMNQQGNFVEGTEMDFDIPANGTAAISLEFPIHVVPADEGVATITYESSAAVTIDTATLIIKRVV